MPRSSLAAGTPRFPDWTAYDVARLGGRDFLGLQSAGDILLDALLPGMTNATRHPRYYAFFCWLFQRAHALGLSAKATEDLTFRYETALVYAAQATHAGDFPGIVGIRSVDRGDMVWQGPERRYSLTKQQWAKRVSAFSAPVYGPSFTRLGLLERHSSGTIALHPAGQRLAETFARGIGATAELERISTRKTAEGHTFVDLHDDLCPCAVRGGAKPERPLLVDLLFRLQDRRSGPVADLDRARRTSLAFLLDLVAAADGDFPKMEDDLRTLLYFWRFPSGARYTPPPALRQTATGWRLFQTRQYQRYAIEAVWVAYLQLIARNGALPFNTSIVVRELGDRIDADGLLTGARTATRRLRTSTLADIESRAQKRIGNNSWATVAPNDTWAEAKWKERIDEALDDDPASTIGSALGLLAMLWLRWREHDDMSVRPFLGAGGRARISVASMLTDFDSRKTMSLPALLAWLLEEYAIGQHMRIATNKLRTEGLDTFWFIAREDGYIMHEGREVGDVRPGYNAPKLWAALSALYDLRLLGRNRDGAYVATAEGKRILEQVIDAEAHA